MTPYRWFLADGDTGLADAFESFISGALLLMAAVPRYRPHGLRPGGGEVPSRSCQALRISAWPLAACRMLATSNGALSRLHEQTMPLFSRLFHRRDIWEDDEMRQGHGRGR